MSVQLVTEKWSILTVRAPNTLALARSLADAGFEAWTPRGWIERRRPRSEIRTEIEVAITPGYVFAAVGQTKAETEAGLVELYRVAKAHGSPHPQFDIFRQGVMAPLVRATELQSLRLDEQASQISSDIRRLAEDARVRKVAENKERKAALKMLRERNEADRRALQAVRARAPVLKRGDRVTTDRAEMVGLVGVVQSISGHETLVLFGGAVPFKIETWQLHPVHVLAGTAA